MSLDASALARAASQARARVLVLLKDTTWEKDSEDKGVTVHIKPPEAGEDASYYRGECRVDAPPEHVLDFIWSIDNRNSWDEHCIADKNVSIDTVDGDSDVVMWAVDVPAPFASDRDFVTYRSRIRERDGSYVVPYITIDHPKAPPDESYERGKALICAFVLAPDRSGRKTTLSYIVQFDLCGYLPAMAVNLVGSRQALCVGTIRDCSERSYVPTEDDDDSPAVLESLFDESDGKFEELEMLAADEVDWDTLGEEDGVIMQSKSVPSGDRVYRGIVRVAKAPLVVLPFLWATNKRNQWDTRTVDAKVLHAFDARMEVSKYIIDSDSSVSSNREYVVLRRWDDRSHGGPSIVEYSVERREAPIPEGDELVRGNVFISGFVLSPMTGESRGTLVKYICKCDTGSSVASGLSAFTAFVPGLSTETPAGFFTSPMTSLKAICNNFGEKGGTSAGSKNQGDSSTPAFIASSAPSSSAGAAESNTNAATSAVTDSDLFSLGSELADALRSGASSVVESVGDAASSLSTEVAAKMQQEQSKQMDSDDSYRGREKQTVLDSFKKASTANMLDSEGIALVLPELTIIFCKNLSEEELLDTIEKLIDSSGGQVSWNEFYDWWEGNRQAELDVQRKAFRSRFNDLCGRSREGLNGTNFMKLCHDFGGGSGHPLAVSTNSVQSKVKQIESSETGQIDFQSSWEWWSDQSLKSLVRQAEKMAAAIDRANPARMLDISNSEALSLVQVCLPTLDSAGSKAVKACPSSDTKDSADWLNLLQWMHTRMLRDLPASMGGKSLVSDKQFEKVWGSLSKDDQEFLEQAFELCDSKGVKHISEADFRSTMEELGFKPKSIKWSSLPLSEDGNVGWKGFVTGLGDWIIESNRKVEKELNKEQTTKDALASHDKILREIAKRISSDSKMTVYEFESALLESLVCSGKPMSKQDIQSTVSQLKELDMRMDAGEFSDWWLSTDEEDRMAEEEDIAVMFAEQDPHSTGYISSDKASDLILDMTSQFPHAEIDEEIVLEFVDTIEDAGELGLEQLQKWWSTNSVQSRLDRLSTRLRWMSETNPNGSQLVAAEEAAELITRFCNQGVLSGPDEAIDAMVSEVEENSQGQVRWTDFLSWLKAYLDSKLT